MLDLLRIQVIHRVTKYIENELSRELVKILVGGKALYPYMIITFFSFGLDHLLHRLHPLAGAHEMHVHLRRVPC
jgi:hypothetical protein